MAVPAMCCFGSPPFPPPTANLPFSPASSLHLHYNPIPSYLCIMEIPKGKKVILFDGVCNLCNGAVNWIIRRDRKDMFRFAPLQGEVGKALTAARHIDTEQVDSIILIDPGMAYYIKSDAALEIARDLKGYGFIPVVFGWIPLKVRDAIYDLVARNRYRFFGKQEACMIPTPELRKKFLETS